MGSWKKDLVEVGRKNGNTLDRFFKKVERPTSEDRRLPEKRGVEIIDTSDDTQFRTLESSMDKERSKSPAQKEPCSPMPNLKRTIEVLSPRLASIKVSCDSPTAKIMKISEPADVVDMEIQEESDEEVVEKIEPDTLTDDEIDKIISANYTATGNGFFTCPIGSCDYTLKSPKSDARSRRANVRRHLVTKHKADKPYSCDEKGCTKKFADPHALQGHKRTVHPRTGRLKCRMPGCYSTFGAQRKMQEHLLFVCIRPAFTFCKECKMQIWSQKRWNSHWTSASHKLNCELLERCGESISQPPTQDINGEIEKAAKDPVAYKSKHRVDGLVGSVSVPTSITSNDAKVKIIQPFEGFIPTLMGSVSGLVWCSEMGVKPKNNCHITIFHNLLSGPQEKVMIPACINSRFGGPVAIIYDLPIVSSSTCTDNIFNYIITCRTHTPTQGTRGIGMILDEHARERFMSYMYTIKLLKEAREKFETENQRAITPQEFAALKRSSKDETNGKNTKKNEWRNCRKYRHFAAKDCSVENLTLNIIATYPQTKEGRNNCILGEAYYQYAVNSCHEESGGLDERAEHDDHKNRSEQLIKLKVQRGHATDSEQKWLGKFTNNK